MRIVGWDVSIRGLRHLPGFRLLAIACLVATGFLAVDLPARAESAGLDLLVLLDQSGSLTGPTAAKVNDPTGRRFQLLNLVATLLAESTDYDRLRHRLSVVNFGSTAHLELPWTEIDRSELAGLGRRFESLVAQPNLGDTDFLAAFEMAAEQFDLLPPAMERRRVILLLTDGIPDKPGLPQAAHQQELERLVAGPIRKLGAALEVAVLCPLDCDAWQRYGDFWLALTGGRARRLPNEEHHALAELFGLASEWISTRVARTEPEPASAGVEEVIILPPYLKTVTFDFFRADKAAEVDIFAPGHPAGPLTAAARNVEESRLGHAIRTITVHRPPPGRWIFRKPRPETEIEIFSRQFFPRGILVRPAEDESPFVNQRASVLYRLLDGGDAFRPLPAYPVSLELAVLRPDGYRRHFTMEAPRAAQSAFYRSTRKAVLDFPGRYQTEVRMVAEDSEGRSVTVFEDHWSGFTVRKETRRLTCELTVPASGAVVPLFGQIVFSQRPVELRLECRHPSGSANLEAAEAAAILEALRPRLDFANQPVEGDLDLRFVSKGVFEGHLEGAKRAGIYDLTLKVEESALPPSLDLEITSSRRRFSRVWSWSHRAQLGLLTLALTAGLALPSFCGHSTNGNNAAGGFLWRRGNDENSRLSTRQKQYGWFGRVG